MRLEFYDPAEYEPDEPVKPRARFGRGYVQDPKNSSLIYAVDGSPTVLTPSEAEAVVRAMISTRFRP